MLIKHRLMEDTPGNGESAAPGAAAAPAVAVAQSTPTPVVVATTETPSPAVAQKWPDDWRKNIAGDDEKILKQLERYATPADIWKKASTLEKRLSSGELRSNLPKDANEDQIKAWRAENGLPESPDKYVLDGVTISEADKPIIDSFLQKAHSVNMTPAQVKTAIEWNRENHQASIEARTAKDKALATETVDHLREEWGNGDFRGNMNMISGMLDMAGEGMKDKIFQARMPDGTPLGSSPEVLKLFLNMAREVNPAGSVSTGDGATQVASIEDEITTIEKMMGDKTSDYWKGPKSEKTQSRYRDLVAARDKIKARKG